MTKKRLIKASAKLALSLVLLHSLATPTSQAGTFDIIGCVIDYSNSMGSCGSISDCGNDHSCINAVGQCIDAATATYHRCVEQAFAVQNQ